MVKSSQKRKYITFMLRMWQESDASSWRSALVDPHTGERHGFPDLKGLFSFLRDKTSPAVRKEKKSANR